MWISSSIGQVEANSSLMYAAFRYLQRFVRDWGMLKFRYFKHTTWRENKRHNQQNMVDPSLQFKRKNNIIIQSSEAPALHSLEQEITFMMWSLGSKLQSDRVSCWPSRKGRDEEVSSSALFSSISSGSGEPRQSSSFFRAFSRPFSKSEHTQNIFRYLQNQLFLTEMNFFFFF